MKTFYLLMPMILFAAILPMVLPPINHGSLVQELRAENAVCDQQVAVSVSSSGNNLLLSGTPGQSIQVCSLTIVFASPVDVTMKSGTGSACGTGTTSLSGTYAQVITFVFEPPIGATFKTPKGTDFCVTLGAAVSGGGTLLYRFVQ